MRIHALSFTTLFFAACAAPQADEASAPETSGREPIRWETDGTTQEAFDARTRYRAMSGEQPDSVNRVVVDAFVVEKSPAVLEVAVRIRIDEGWHIYARVPDGQPYVVTDISLETPDGVIASEEWDLPAPHASLATAGVEEWSGEVIFLREFDANEDFDREEPFVVNVAYQACDERTCLPPANVTIEVALE